MEEIKTKLKEAITLIAEASDGLTQASYGLTKMNPFDFDKYVKLSDTGFELSVISRKLEDFEESL